MRHSPRQSRPDKLSLNPFETRAPQAVASLDLILRWAVVRINEGNTQTLLSVLAMVKVRRALGACASQGLGCSKQPA